MDNITESDIRDACAEAGISPKYAQVTIDWIRDDWITPFTTVILALARRIAAERDRKRPWCETCGKDVPEILCPTCAKWWHDNPPDAERMPHPDRIAAEREAVPVAWQYKRKDFVPAVSVRKQSYADLQWQKPLYAHPPKEPTPVKIGSGSVLADNSGTLYNSPKEPNDA
jgi:hypothetical protein